MLAYLSRFPSLPLFPRPRLRVGYRGLPLRPRNQRPYTTTYRKVEPTPPPQPPPVAQVRATEPTRGPWNNSFNHERAELKKHSAETAGVYLYAKSNPCCNLAAKNYSRFELLEKELWRKLSL